MADDQYGGVLGGVIRSRLFGGSGGEPQHQFGELVAAGRRARKSMPSNSPPPRSDVKHDAEQIVRVTRCLLLGAFVQDNLADLQFLLNDYGEWPEESRDADALDKAIQTRFDTLRTVVNTEGPGCGVPDGTADGIAEAEGMFGGMHWRGAADRLRDVEHRLQEEAYEV